MKNIYLIFVLPVICIIMACQKKKTNERLYEEATASNLILYQGKDTVLSAAGGSPHGSFKLQFNYAAIYQFGADGKLPKGTTFQNGALIVKEVYVGGQLSLYAVMKKQKSKFASSGWLWAEYSTDGKAIYSIGEKGKSCVPCHSGSPNRDLTRSFDLH